MDKAAYLEFVIEIIRSSDGQKRFEVLPSPLGPLDPTCVVFDIVPKPDMTPLMACARKAGCRIRAAG
jgi:shikimate 5-dehydrogenase